MFRDWARGNLMNKGRTLSTHWNISSQWGSTSSQIWTQFSSQVGIHRQTTPFGGLIGRLSIPPPSNTIIFLLISCEIGQDRLRNGSISQKRTLFVKFFTCPTITVAMTCFFISGLLCVSSWCTLSPRGWGLDRISKYVHPRRDRVCR